MQKFLAVVALAAVLTLGACADSSEEQSVNSVQVETQTSQGQESGDPANMTPPENEIANQQEGTASPNSEPMGAIVCNAVDMIAFLPADYEISIAEDIKSNLSYIEENRPYVLGAVTALEQSGGNFTSAEKVQFLSLGFGLFSLERAMDRWQNALTGYGDPSDIDLDLVDEYGSAVNEGVNTVKGTCY